MSVALYNRSCYSLLESTITIDSLVKYAVNNGFSAVGICDRNNFYAANQFYNLCKKNKIQPVIGIECSFTYNNSTYPVCFYPKNNQGYIYLLHQTFNNSVFTYQQIQNFSEDVLIVFPYQSLIYQFVIKDNYQQLESVFSSFSKNMYLGLPANNKLLAKQYNEKLHYYINRYKLNSVPFDLSLYQSEDYFDSYKALLVMDKASYFDDEKIKYSSQSYLKSKQQFESLFSKEQLFSSDQFSRQIDLHLDEIKSGLPAYQNNLVSISSNSQYLKDLSLAGLKKRLNNNSSEQYLDRLNYELEIIIKMGFTDYFLIIYDLMLFCKKNNILVGAGRGSAVGSLVCYCLGITHIDPIQYDLYFERFLNPSRVSLPDIDLDFCDDQRNDVVKYLSSKYGYEKVASIITFNCFQNKSAIRETSRILKGTNSSMELLLKIIDDYDNKNLKEIYQESKAFNTIVNSSKINQLLYKIASQIENLPRHVSIHASGIVISSKDLLDVVPLIDYNDNLTVCYTYDQLEAIGLIKFDILSLRNLSIVRNIINSIDLKTPIYQIDKNDIKSYQTLTNGYTLSIFQLESKGMKNLLAKVKPTDLIDLAVLIALYRPGPINNINSYIANRNSKQITYLHDDLKPILASTSGVIVFQEQIMEIAVKFAGFSLAEADILRKAIAKKDGDLLSQNRNKFIEGCINNGYQYNLANKLFEMIEKFGLYGFNKAHSFGYAFLAYIMAYLKTNFTSAFYCKTLDEYIGDSKKTLELIAEARLLNMTFSKIDINTSIDKYLYKNGSIFLPFSYIKGLSSNIVLKILKEREERGEFKDFFDFYFRMCEHSITTEEVGLLIDCGAFESFKVNATTLKNNIFVLQNYYQTVSGNDKLKETVSVPVLTNYKQDRKQERKMQYQIYGFYFDDDPFSQYRKQFKDCVNSNSPIEVNRNVEMILRIESINIRKTKKSVEMAIISASDSLSTVELIIYGKRYQMYQNQLKKDIIVHVNVTKNINGNFFVNKLEVLED